MEVKKTLPAAFAKGASVDAKKAYADRAAKLRQQADELEKKAATSEPATDGIGEYRERQIAWLRRLAKEAEELAAMWETECQ